MTETGTQAGGGTDLHIGIGDGAGAATETKQTGDLRVGAHSQEGTAALDIGGEQAGLGRVQAGFCENGDIVGQEVALGEGTELDDGHAVQAFGTQDFGQVRAEGVGGCLIEDQQDGGATAGRDCGRVGWPGAQSCQEEHETDQKPTHTGQGVV